MTNKHLNRRFSQCLEVDIPTLATNEHTSPRRTRVVQALNARLGSVSVFLIICKILLCSFLEDLVELVVRLFESSAHLLLELLEGAHPELCLMLGWTFEEECDGRAESYQSFKANCGVMVNC
jgi:hypothetical protein